MINLLQNERFAKIAGGTAGAVYVTTGLKAIARPAFILGDKKSDAETKKYSATKEFLYQALCLGITVCLLPFFKFGGYKIAEKFIKKEGELAETLKKINGTNSLLDKINVFKKIKTFKAERAAIKASDKSDSAKQAMTIADGGIEAASLIGSILGLTIIAPLVSHKIIHPIMNVLGMDKKAPAKTQPSLPDAQNQNGQQIKLNA